MGPSKSNSFSVEKVPKDATSIVEKVPNNDATSNVETSKPRSLAPMTKEEWEKRQSVVRRVFDEDTGGLIQIV
jgi:hypothetical protein